MKYFILKGLIPEPMKGAPIFGGQLTEGRKARIARWKKTGLKFPKEGEQCFLRVENIRRISVFIHNVYDALLMITARSQEKAYMPASPLRDFVGIYFGLGLAEENISEYLMELIGKPQPAQTRRQIAELYRQDIWTYPVDQGQIWIELGTSSIF